MSQTNNCRLCVNRCEDFKSLYDENGQPNALYQIIVKYFHPTVLNILKYKRLTGICRRCWNQIWEFCNFQKFVHDAQFQLVDHLQNQYNHEQLFDPVLDITLSNFIESETEMVFVYGDQNDDVTKEELPTAESASTVHYFIEEPEQMEAKELVLSEEKLPDLGTADILSEEFLEEEFSSNSTAIPNKEEKFDNDFIFVEEILENDEDQDKQPKELTNESTAAEEETPAVSALNNYFVQMTQEVGADDNTTVIKYRGITISVLHKNEKELKKHITLEKSECQKCRRKKAVSTGISKSECKICHKLFTSPQGLDQHYLTNHGIDSFPMAMCKICGKLFDKDNKSDNDVKPILPTRTKSTDTSTKCTVNRTKNPTINRPKHSASKIKYPVGRRAFKLPATKFLKRLQSFQTPSDLQE